jgi:hypothetical protein
MTSFVQLQKNCKGEICGHYVLASTRATEKQAHLLAKARAERPKLTISTRRIGVSAPVRLMTSHSRIYVYLTSTEEQQGKHTFFERQSFETTRAVSTMSGQRQSVPMLGRSLNP